MNILNTSKNQSRKKNSPDKAMFFDVFAKTNESPEKGKARRKRLSEIEDLEADQSICEQINSLYKSKFIRLGAGPGRT